MVHSTLSQPQQFPYPGQVAPTDFGAGVGAIQACQHATVAQRFYTKQPCGWNKAVAVQAYEAIGVDLLELAQGIFDQQFAVAVLHDDVFFVGDQADDFAERDAYFFAA